MAVIGTYEITITTPMGTRTHTLILETNNNTLNGTLTGPFGKQSISDGTINGNDISWSVELKPPRGFKAIFNERVQGCYAGYNGRFRRITNDRSSARRYEPFLHGYRSRR